MPIAWAPVRPPRVTCGEKAPAGSDGIGGLDLGEKADEWSYECS